MSDVQTISTEALLAHRGFVRRLARSLLADGDAAEDLAQETWRTVLERPPGAVRDPRAWLGGVVRNLARLHVRGEARRRRREVESSAAAGAMAEPAAQAAARVDEMGQLLAALRRLEEPFHTAVVLRFYDGLPPRDIARRLGVPVETVKSRLQRGLARLRRELQARAEAERGAGASWRAIVLPLARLPRRAAVALSFWAGAALLAGLVPIVWVALGSGSYGVRPLVPERNDPGKTYEKNVPDSVRLATEAPAEGAGGVDSGGERGPAYRLRLLGPAARTTGPLSARLGAADPRREFATAFGRVEADAAEGLWVARFGAEAARLRGSAPWRLEVRSDDGFWLGAVDVESANGAPRQVVFPVELVPCGTLRGRLTEADGAAIGQARVTARDARGASFYAATDDDGRYALRWLPPGDYAASASTHRHEAWHGRARVEPGVDVELDGVLAALRGGVVAGRVRGRAGVFAGTVHVVLSERDGERVFVQRVDARAGEPGTFRFDGLPLAEYDVSVHTDTFHRWITEPASLSPPIAGLELVCADDAPARDLTVRVVDAATGAPIDAFRGFARLDGRDDPATTKVQKARGGAWSLRRVPADATLEWVVSAPGYVAQDGDERGFDGRGTRTVRLRRGWGNRLRVVGPNGAPVAGVPLAFDGVAVGATGPAGSLRVELPARPRVLAVTTDAWRIAGGDVFGDGTFDDLIWGITVVVGAAEPSRKRRDR